MQTALGSLGCLVDLIAVWVTNDEDVHIAGRPALKTMVSGGPRPKHQQALNPIQGCKLIGNDMTGSEGDFHQLSQRTNGRVALINHDDTTAAKAFCAQDPRLLQPGHFTLHR